MHATQHLIHSGVGSDPGLDPSLVFGAQSVLEGNGADAIEASDEEMQESC